METFVRGDGGYAVQYGLKNFLKGMETDVGTQVKPRDSTSKTSLKGWKLTTIVAGRTKNWPQKLP